MRINKSARMRFIFEGIWIQGNLISKLSRKSKMKSQDPASRRKRPDGRTRRSHAPKRVASRHYQAAETRPKPRFRGNLALSIYQFSWRSLSGTLSPSAPINTPAGAAERASRENQGFSLAFLKFCKVVILFQRHCGRRSLYLETSIRIKVTSFAYLILVKFISL